MKTLDGAVYRQNEHQLKAYTLSLTAIEGNDEAKLSPATQPF